MAPAARKKILIVDDDRTIHAFLKMVLEKAGYASLSALDALQGTAMARQLSPDLVILDMAMPAGGGVSVLDRLRQLTTTNNIPVVILSALPREEVEKAVGPGTEILSKPATPDQVLAAVRTALGEAPTP